MSEHTGQVGASGVVKRGRGRPRKVPLAIPPPVAAPEPPARRGRGRPRLDAETRAADLDDRLSLAMLEARSAGVLGSDRRGSAPGIRFDVAADAVPDLSAYDLAMLADAMTAMLSAGSSEAYGRRRAWEILRQVYDKRPEAERLRHVDAAHALLVHDGHRLALNDMSERRYAGAILAGRLDQIFTRCMDPEVFARAAGVALKAATLRAKLHGIDVDSMKIELKAEVSVEHSDPVRDAIVQRLIQAKEAAQRANAAAIDVRADDDGD